MSSEVECMEIKKIPLSLQTLFLKRIFTTRIETINNKLVLGQEIRFVKLFISQLWNTGNVLLTMSIRRGWLVSREGMSLDLSSPVPFDNIVGRNKRGTLVASITTTEQVLLPRRVEPARERNEQKLKVNYTDALLVMFIRTEFPSK